MLKFEPTPVASLGPNPEPTLSAPQGAHLSSRHQPEEGHTAHDQAEGHDELEEEDYSEFEGLMAALPSDSARELLELLADGSELHVTQIASQIGGTSLSVSLLRNAVNRSFEQLNTDLYVHSEFKPKLGDRPLGIYYCLTRTS